MSLSYSDTVYSGSCTCVLFYSLLWCFCDQIITWKVFRNQQWVSDQTFSDLLSGDLLSVLSWPHAPRQTRQDERDEDWGEQIDCVIVQDGFPTYPPCGGRLVTHHLPDARVEAWTHEEETSTSLNTFQFHSWCCTSVIISCSYLSIACELPGKSPASIPSNQPRRRTPWSATADPPGAGHRSTEAASQSKPSPPWPHLESWRPIRRE